MNETIVALSSGSLKAAIAIIRLSGEQSFEILSSIFSNKKEYEHQKIYYGYIMDEQTTIDEVMVSCFVAPHSFTCENMVEINCHGNPYIIQQIIALCIKHGARIAERAEFTKRAILNGRIDLIKAESINDLILASNKQAVQLALSGLKGLTSEYVYQLSEKLLDVLGVIEVNIDYPEYDDVEELTDETILPKINQFLNLLEKVIADTKKGQTIKDGIQTVILGKPNVGKSSLLNALLKEDKAIVTDIAGTTRDIVEGKIDFDGITLHLMDTAGIHQGMDKIEKIGIQKSIDVSKNAELILLVLDASKPLQEEDLQLLELTKNQPRILILNKSDLPLAFELKDAVQISAQNQQLKELEDKIHEMYKDLQHNQDPLLFNARQLGLLNQAKQHLLEAQKQSMQHQVIDLIYIDLEQAYKCILEILGKNPRLDLLEHIFSKFCLGK